MTKKFSYFSVDVTKTKTIIFDKMFVVGILFYYIMMYSLPNSLVAKFAPLIAPLVVYFYLSILEVDLDNNRFLSPFFWLVGFSVVVLIYIGFDDRLSIFSSTEAIYFFSLPLMFLASFRLINKGHNHFINSALFIFLAFQAIVILGQFMKMKTGYGLYAPAEYSGFDNERYISMLSGTFVNANDLASITVMIALFFMINRKVCKTLYGSTISIGFFVVIVTASRSSFVMFLFLFLVLGLRGISTKKVGLILLIPTMAYFLYIFGFGDGNVPAVDRVASRLATISDIFTFGISSDNSSSMRIESYLNFLNNLCNLGFGTVEYRNYSSFVSSLGPAYSLMGINPHSFFVEIGYWLGWPGLALFSLFLLSCLMLISIERWLLVVAVFIVMSSVSSSIMGNFIFILVFFFCLQDPRNRAI